MFMIPQTKNLLGEKKLQIFLYQNFLNEIHVNGKIHDKKNV